MQLKSENSAFAKGVLHSINPTRAFIAIKTESNGFTIVEMLHDTQLEIGDVIEWKPAKALGRHECMNVSRGIKFDGYFQNHGVAPQQLRQQLRLDP